MCTHHSQYSASFSRSSIYCLTPLFTSQHCARHAVSYRETREHEMPTLIQTPSSTSPSGNTQLILHHCNKVLPPLRFFAFHHPLWSSEANLSFQYMSSPPVTPYH